jgi:radical SAM superfamily enzyme
MKKIYFWQPAHYTIFQGNPSYWLPYSVGCLWSFARSIPKIAENYVLGDFIFKRDPISKMMENIIDPDIAVFSNYVWNYQYNRTAARAVKERYPNCFIIFGGPQVTKFPEEKKFFENNPFVDCVVNGEGELVFAELLENLIDGINPNKVLKFSRLKEVSYPSPYTNGIFDDIVARHPEYHWQAVLETNRGCPYACTFCDWGSATYSKIVKISEQRVLDDITWMSKNKVDYCFIADANFGILYERDKKFAEHMNHYQTTVGYPKVILAQWAKNSKEKILDIAKIFFNGHNRGFTISVQSMDDVVLEAIKRKNMETSDMTKMLELCEKQNISAYTELLIGLPYETKDTWRNNHFKLLELGQHNFIDIWFTQTLENSELNSIEQRKQHQLVTVDIPKFVTGVNIVEGDIPENETVVVGTKYMPREDLIKSYLFSSVIMHFHYMTGSTNILSRFLRKYNNLPYDTFYSYLENNLRERSLWISTPYFRLQSFMACLTSGRIQESDKDLRHNAHNNIWVAGTPLLLDRTKLFDDLLTIFSKEWCKLDSELYKQLIDFQQRLVYDKNSVYPYSVTYDYDFVDFLNKGKVLVEKPTKVVFEYEQVWNSDKQFLEHAYFERRTREVVNANYRVVDED